MAGVYGHEVASRFQQNAITCVSGSWTKLEGTTALTNRVGTELYNKGQAATAKLYLTFSYNGETPTIGVKYCKAIETGAYHFEPNGPGLTLWGRTQAATARVIVTEYGS
jgi:hypothetical protein